MKHKNDKPPNMEIGYLQGGGDSSGKGVEKTFPRYPFLM